jgi:hypothetical protein
MQRSALTLVLILAAVVVRPASAQTPVAPACLPAATLDQLPKALDEAISGPADKDRTCLRQLMSPDLRLILVTGDSTRILSLDDWINAVSKRGNTLITERQVKVRTESYGNIAHLWCTYEMRSAPDGPFTSRGINSLQALFDGQRWQLISVMYQAETPAQPIPGNYLP